MNYVSANGRYYVQRHGFWWHVHAGNGTRTLFKSLRWKTAARVAAELGTAFCDGNYWDGTDDLSKRNS